MSEIRCTNCSTMNREGAAFCRSCGTGLDTPSAPEITPAQVQPTVSYEGEAGNESRQPSPPAPAEQPYDRPAASPQPLQPVPAYRPVSPPARAARPAAAGSRSWLRTSANLAAVVLGIIFVFLVSEALPVLNVSSDLLDGEKYKASLREQDVYNRFPDLFAEQMQRSQSSLEQEARLDLSGVTAADWKLIATQLVTPQWMQSQVESLIDQTFNAAKGDAAAPKLELNLTEVTQRLSGDAGFNIYKQIIATKRSCSLDDFFNIIDWMSEEPGVRLPICNIPPFLTDIAALIGGYENGDELIKDLLKELPGAIPATVSLSDFFSLRMDRVAGWVNNFRIVAWISLLLALAALLGMLISPFVRTLKGWLLSWGACLAAAGMVCLLISQVLPYTLGGLIVGAFSGEIAPSLAKIILETGRSVTASGATSLAWQSGAMLLVGLAMAGAGALVWGVGKYRS